MALLWSAPPQTFYDCSCLQRWAFLKAHDDSPLALSEVREIHIYMGEDTATRVGVRGGLAAWEQCARFLWSLWDLPAFDHFVFSLFSLSPVTIVCCCYQWQNQNLGNLVLHLKGQCKKGETCTNQTPKSKVGLLVQADGEHISLLSFSRSQLK